MDEPRQPMNVECRYCCHRWILLYMPMMLGDAANIMSDARCPMCAKTDIFIIDCP